MAFFCSVLQHLLLSTDAMISTGHMASLITRSDITYDWLVGVGQGNSGQILFTQFLVELAYHLFEGEIEMDTLNTKVLSLIKKQSYRKQDTRYLQYFHNVLVYLLLQVFSGRCYF
jgi:hypothetical protein